MFNPKSNTYRFVKNNMMLQKNEAWQIGGDNGQGDALWRTAMAYICYERRILKTGILFCFRKFKMINKKKFWYQGARSCKRFREDDFSRDQTIMALTTLKINNDKELKEIGLKLPFRLSRRFRMGLTLWVWIRAITGKGKFYTYLFGVFELCEFLPSVLWNKFLRKIMGWNKEYSAEWYLGYDFSKGFWSYEDDKWIWKEGGCHMVNNGHKLYNAHLKKKQKNWFYRLMYTIEYPEYAMHLTAWMLYVSDDTFLKRFLQKLTVWLAEKDNLLIRLLAGVKVDKCKIEEFSSMKGYRWSVRFNGTSYTYYLKGDDTLYNTIDKDVLNCL